MPLVASMQKIILGEFSEHSSAMFSLVIVTLFLTIMVGNTEAAILLIPVDNFTVGTRQVVILSPTKTPSLIIKLLQINNSYLDK